MPRVFNVPFEQNNSNDCLKGVLTMRGNLVFGMIAGGVIGAAAAVIAMPYIRPQIQHVMQRSKNAINTKMDKIGSGN